MLNGSPPIKGWKSLFHIIVFSLRICLSCDRRDEQPGLREQRQREWRRRNHSNRSSRNLVDGAHCDNAELYDGADPDGDVTFSFDVASPVCGLPFRRQHGVEQPHLRLRLHEVTQSYDGEFEARCLMRLHTLRHCTVIKLDYIPWLSGIGTSGITEL